MTLASTSLTKSQAARRGRVIDAALSLGADGGYDAVQMRDVATTAGVALGTIYRYFSSKDHLLAETLVEWANELGRKVSRKPAKGETSELDFPSWELYAQELVGKDVVLRTKLVAKWRDKGTKQIIKTPSAEQMASGDVVRTDEAEVATWLQP